jgi:hypothetical protein
MFIHKYVSLDNVLCNELINFYNCETRMVEAILV